MRNIREFSPITHTPGVRLILLLFPGSRGALPDNATIIQRSHRRQLSGFTSVFFCQQWQGAGGQNSDET
ncbi:hypothetical protein ACP3S7_27085 [Phytobacter ursingii]